MSFEDRYAPYMMLWADRLDSISEGAEPLEGELHRMAVQLRNMAEEIGTDHERRMEQAKREMRRSSMHYMRQVANDYEHGIKRVRKQ